MPGVSKLRAAKPFHLAREASLSMMEKQYTVLTKKLLIW